MSVNKIESLLHQHGITTKNVNGNLLALEEWSLNGEYGCAWVSTKGWTTKNLLDFLNY